MADVFFNTISSMSIPDGDANVDVGVLSVQGGDELWRKKIILNTTISPAGSGSVVYGSNPGIADFTENTAVGNFIYWGLDTKIKAVPASGKVFSHWDSDTSLTNASRTLTAITNATNSKTITANFKNAFSTKYWDIEVDGDRESTKTIDISTISNGTTFYVKKTNYSGIIAENGVSTKYNGTKKQITGRGGDDVVIVSFVKVSGCDTVSVTLHGADNSSQAHGSVYIL